MMGPQWKAWITTVILLLVLAAFVLTSFGCRHRKSSPFHPDEITAECDPNRPHAAIIEEVSLS